MVNEIVRLLLSMSVTDWITIGFGIIGVIGTTYGYLSWRASKKQKKLYSYLFELAERNIDKSVTEQELAERRKAVEEASSRIEALQENIRRDIPRAAKRAVMTDRLKTQIEIMHQHYESVMKLRSELHAIGAFPELPPELLRAIEQEIEPEFFIREKRSRLKTNLSIITAGAAIASASLPHPIDSFVSIALLLLAVPIVFLLLRLALKEQAKMDSVAAKKWIAGGSLAAGFVLLSLAVGLGILAIIEARSTEFAGPFGAGLGFLSAFLLFFGFRTLWQLKQVKTRAGRSNQ